MTGMEIWSPWMSPISMLAAIPSTSSISALQNMSFRALSDLLLAALIERSRQQGKRFINLGLGINPGIAAFKLKWGAEKFLHYSAYVQRLGEQVPLEDLLGSFLR